jgi:hypothetical protein
MTDDPTEAFEHSEHADHAAHSGNRFVALVALSIAVLAAVAAASGSLESIETEAATSFRSTAVLLQNKATDNWNFFEAKSLKKNMYDIAAQQGGSAVAGFQAAAQRNEADSVDIQKTAKDFEAQSEAALKNAEVHEARGHRLTFASTLLHIAIAVATVAIITSGKRWPWYTSIVLGAVGIVVGGTAYLA